MVIESQIGRYSKLSWLGTSVPVAWMLRNGCAREVELC
jgi:hypothetical protein